MDFNIEITRLEKMNQNYRAEQNRIMSECQKVLNDFEVQIQKNLGKIELLQEIAENSEEDQV